MPCKTAKGYPHFSDETIRRPALIPGESGDSGHNPCLNARAKLALFSPSLERFSADDPDGIPDSRSGLIVGDFWNRVCFQSRPFFLQKIGSRAYWAFQFAAKPGLLDDYVVDVEVSLH